MQWTCLHNVTLMKIFCFNFMFLVSLVLLLLLNLHNHKHILKSVNDIIIWKFS